MAAPKADGMLFRGNLQGEPKPTGRLLCGIVFVMEPVFLSRFLRVRRAQKEISGTAYRQIPASIHETGKAMP